MTGSDRAARLSLLPVGALILAMTSLTLGASVAKRLYPLVGPEGATTLRLVLGALMLAAVLRPWRARLSAIAWPTVIVYGLAMGSMNLLFYSALKTLPLGIAISLEFTGPLAVAVASSRRGIDLLWIALAIAGLVLLLPLTRGAPRLDPGGVALALGAGVGWAVYIIAGKRAGQAHGVVTTSLGMIIGALAVLPIGLAHAGAALFSPTILVSGLAVAVLSGAVPYTLEMVALRHLPAQTYGTLTSCEPAVGALMGLLLLGERLAPVQCCAMAMVMAASMGATMTAMRDRRKASAALVAA
ncbi:MAG: EamA family transporter [Caulobacteraceae bacterium]